MRILPTVLSMLAGACALQGCVLKNYVVDEAQVDALTYCAVGDTARPFGGDDGTWGRTRGRDDRVYWSHYALGTFACKTQDEWLCEARTGRKDCAGEPLHQQLARLGIDRQDDEMHVRFRNETQSEMLMQADRLCDRYLASIFGEQAGNALALDVSGSLLSGAAAIASGTTARNLAASAALVGATGSHINADVYQNQVATAINLLIRKKRAAARGILHNNQACGLARYPAADAVRDVLSYHNMCSFEYGLSELVHEASDTSPVRGSVATLTLQRLKKELADLVAKPVDASDAAAKTRYDAQISELRSQIRVYEGFGISVPAAVAPLAPKPDAVAPAAPAAATQARVPSPAASAGASQGEGDCSPLPVIPLSG